MKEEERAIYTESTKKRMISGALLLQKNCAHTQTMNELATATPLYHTEKQNLHRNVNYIVI